MTIENEDYLFNIFVGIQCHVNKYLLDVGVCYISGIFVGFIPTDGQKQTDMVLVLLELIVLWETDDIIILWGLPWWSSG